MYNENPPTASTNIIPEPDDDQFLLSRRVSMEMKNASAANSVPTSPQGTVTISTHKGYPNSLKRHVSMSPRRTFTPLVKRGTVAHFPARYASEQLEYRPEIDDPRNLPIAVFYGGSDTLLDMRSLLKGLRFPYQEVRDWIVNPQEGRCPGLPEDFRGVMEESVVDAPLLGYVVYQRGRKGDAVDIKVKAAGSPVVFLKCIPQYEHLCFLWADSAYRELFPDVLAMLKQYNPVS